MTHTIPQTVPRPPGEVLQFRSAAELDGEACKWFPNYIESARMTRMRGDIPAVCMIESLPFIATVDGECLDTSLPSRIGGIDVDVTTPRMEERAGEPGRWRMCAPEGFGIDRGLDWGALLGSNRPWGGPSQWHTDRQFGAGDAAYISHILVSTQILSVNSGDAAHQIGVAVQVEIDAWANLLGDWLEVLAARWFRRPNRHGAVLSGQAGPISAWHFDGSSSTRLENPNSTRAVGLGGDGIPLANWSAALRLAGECRVPPVERILLRDARVGVGIGDFRRAVLDAATATEIALALLLDRKTASAGPDISKAVRDGVRGLVSLSDILRKTFKERGISPRVQIDIAEPRNKAIHSGSQPSRDEANTAIVTAAAVLETVSPISELLA